MKSKMILPESVFNTKIEFPQSEIITKRDATSNVLDGNNNTSDQINWNFNEHEYRFPYVVKFKECVLTVTINQGEGWPCDTNADFYYIPPGEINAASYIKFGTFNYPGMVDLINHKITVSVPNWVYANGVYVVYIGNNIEGGWATINEVKLFTTVA